MHLAHGSWADAEAVVGRVFAHRVGADAVNVAMVRHLLESMEWDLPRALDSDAAQAAGLPGPEAPASSYMTFGMPAYWRPGEASLPEGVIAPFPFGEVPCPGDGIFATGTSVEFRAPVLHGDQLRSSWRLNALTRKTLSIGDGAFLEFEVTYRNQHDVIVVVEHTTVFRYELVEDV